MPVRILDSESPPPLSTFQAAKSAGYAGWAGYCGGPDAAGNPWPASSVQEVRSVFGRVYLFYVGLSPISGSMLQAARSCGLIQGDLVGHDVETPQAVAGLSDTVADLASREIRSGGYHSVLYGLPSLCARYGKWYDAVHYAGGPYYRTGKTPPPADPRESGFGLSNPNQSWQWWGSHSYLGWNVDESICDDWFGGIGVEMDYDVIVKGWYRFPPMNRNPLQSEVDGWVAKILAGENSEQVMDDFMSTTEYQQKLAALYGQSGGEPIAQSILTKLHNL